MDLHLSAFQVKVQDLWKALLKENFVFSFKNTQEIIAYNSLETEYSKWDWEFREAMLKWELVAENEISAAEVHSAAALAELKHKELQEHTASLCEPIKAKMKIFFSGKYSEILVQWKAKFERRLENRIEELKEHATRHCKKLCASKEAISKFEQSKKIHAAEITRGVQDYIVYMKREQEEIIENLKDKGLNEHQLEKILKWKVFAVGNLKAYKRENIITEDQLESIKKLIDHCNDHLTIPVLREIMFGRILGLEQVKKILMEGKYSEEELKVKFDDIWTDLIKQVPCVHDDTVSIEREVERILIEFASKRGYGSQLVAMMQEGKEKKWGTKLSLIPEEHTHYTKVDINFRRTGPFFSYLLPGGKKINSTSDPHLIEALKVTEAVFNKADQCLRRISLKKTGYKSSFTVELLSIVDTAVTAGSITIKDKVAFTPKYRLTVFLIVCGYVTPVFKKMSESFKERTDPLLYLEKHVKKPLFTKFKDQYYQTKAEEAVANTLCVLFEVPIKDQIKKTIGAKIVSGMKSSRHHFSSKMALKVKILTDLYREDKYEGYMAYVRNVQGCLQQRIKEYTVQYADERVSGETRLQILAKEEVSRLIGVVETTIVEVNETEIQEWLTTFSKDQQLIGELGYINVDNLLTGFDSLHEMNLDNFKLQIQSGLQELKKTLHTSFGGLECEEDMTQWKDKPHDLLADLIGCTEQCPFCGEQCDLLDPDHFREGNQKHRTGVHRPSCLIGWRNMNTRVMISDFCTSLVSYPKSTFKNNKTQQQLHPCNQYASVYPEWSIPPDATAETCLYWKWFVARYSRNLAETYNANPPNVPRGWHGMDIEWPEVEQSLKEAYKA